MIPRPQDPGYQWVVLAVGTVIMFFSIPASPPGFAPYVDPMMADLGINRGQLGVAFLLGTVGAGFLMPRMGRIIDRDGARKATTKGLVFLGLTLVGFGFLPQVQRILTVSPELREPVAMGLLIVGFCAVRSFGLGMVMNGSRTMIFRWFLRRRGLAASINGAILSVLFSASPIFLNGLIRLFGWQGSWWVLGAVTVTVVVVLCHFTFRDSPEACGHAIDAEEVREGADGGRDLAEVRDYTVAEARRTVAYWIFLAGLSINVLIGTGIALNVVSLAEVLGGIARDDALALFVPSSLFNILSVTVLGLVSARIRMRYVHYFMVGSQLVALLGLLNLGTDFGYAAFVVGNGTAWGAFGVMINVPWPRFYGRTHLGAINGSVLGATVIASALGPALFGMSFEYLGSYLPMMVFCFLAASLILLAGVAAANPQRKQSQSGEASTG